MRVIVLAGGWVGKFWFYDRDFGEVGGLPRLIDIGQCTDAYSAIQFLEALSDELHVGISELPLSIFFSWHDERILSVLLSFLALGIKGVRLGPTFPAFMNPYVRDFLAKHLDLKLITTPDEDLKQSWVRNREGTVGCLLKLSSLHFKPIQRCPLIIDPSSVKLEKLQHRVLGLPFWTG